MLPRSRVCSAASSVLVVLCAAFSLPGVVYAQACPQKNLNYWQAFPAGGEWDISARHQQAVLKKRCPGIDTVIQYKPGAGGGLMWAQMNALPGDGLNIIGINLPHIILQPLKGQVQYKTEDVTPPMSDSTPSRAPRQHTFHSKAPAI